MKILLGISFDGSAYHGWQVQPGTVTVQQTFQDACEHIFGARLPVTGCSRTDSGVHARKFYCTIEGDIRIPCARIPDALNSVLREDIAVFSAKEVDIAFHPRYSCKSKEYLYDICVAPFREPLSSGRSWQLCRSLDVDLMNDAARYLFGTHDFASFCASGSGVADTSRTVYKAVFEHQNEHVIFRIRADGFLYNMVRIITGTFVAVGTGKLSPDAIEKIIASRDRAAAGITAPACGLYLNEVFYNF